MITNHPGLRLLEEGATIGEPAMEGIARGANVGKTTICRRWPGKGALLMDVLTTLGEPTPELRGRSVTTRISGDVAGANALLTARLRL